MTELSKYDLYIFLEKLLVTCMRTLIIYRLYVTLAYFINLSEYTCTTLEDQGVTLKCMFSQIMIMIKNSSQDRLTPGLVTCCTC